MQWPNKNGILLSLGIYLPSTIEIKQINYHWNRMCQEMRIGHDGPDWCSKNNYSSYHKLFSNIKKDYISKIKFFNTLSIENFIFILFICLLKHGHRSKNYPHDFNLQIFMILLISMVDRLSSRKIFSAAPEGLRLQYTCTRSLLPRFLISLLRCMRLMIWIYD